MELEKERHPLSFFLYSNKMKPGFILSEPGLCGGWGYLEIVKRYKILKNQDFLYEKIFKKITPGVACVHTVIC